MTPKISLVFGTRPEAVKLAPVYEELIRRQHRFQVEVIVTGQHRQMLDQMLQTFDIVPDIDLDVMQADQSLAEVTTRMLAALQQAFENTAPDLVVVQGDTCTCFSAALASYYTRTDLAHVEAGLRTDDKYSPFPEEIYRRLTDQMADMHLAATPHAKHNLLGEGISIESVFVTGNPVVDALHMMLERSGGLANTDLHWVEDITGRVCVLTAHRRESLGVPLTQIFLAVKQLVEEFTDLNVIYPMHMNPKVRRAAREILADVERVVLCDTLDYVTFIALLSRADLVITDSGGIQEEAPALGVPVIVVRDRTERPEGVWAGVARVVGTQAEHIVSEVGQLLDSATDYRRMAAARCPYGDGRAAKRICDAIEYHLNLRDTRPREFRWDAPQAGEAEGEQAPEQ